MMNANRYLSGFKQLSVENVGRVIQKPKNKESGVDGITKDTLQDVFEAVGDRFMQRVYTSLLYGTLPVK